MLCPFISECEYQVIQRIRLHHHQYRIDDGYRCSISSIERLISSSRNWKTYGEKTDNGIINHRSICYRCCDTIGQIEQIQNHIEQLNNEEQILNA